MGMMAQPTKREGVFGLPSLICKQTNFVSAGFGFDSGGH